MKPPEINEFLTFEWTDIKPYYEDLLERELTEANVHAWLDDWSDLAEKVQEMGARLRVNSTRFTEDEEIEAAYKKYLKNIFPHVQPASHQLQQKLLDSGLEPEGMEIPIQKIRVRARIFREENVPLYSEESRIGIEFNKLMGAQTLEWEGKEYTLTQLSPIYEAADRETRKTIWDMVFERESQDRQQVNEYWQQYGLYP